MRKRSFFCFFWCYALVSSLKSHGQENWTPVSSTLEVLVNAAYHVEASDASLEIWLDAATESRDIPVSYMTCVRKDDIAADKLNDWLRRFLAVVTKDGIDRSANPFLQVCQDDQLHPMTRVFSALATQASSPKEKAEREIAAFLALSYYDKTLNDKDLLNRIKADISKKAPVVVGLIDLGKAIEGSTELHANVSGVPDALKQLRSGKFFPFFVLPKVEQDAKFAIKLKSEKVEQTILVSPETFHEGFRSGELLSEARRLRFLMFKDAFASVRYLIATAPESTPLQMYEAHRLDIDLLTARMIQCDSKDEYLSATISYMNCKRIAGLEKHELVFNHFPEGTRIAEAVEEGIRTPNFLLGNVLVDQHSICSKLRTIGREWEAFALEDLTRRQGGTGD